MQIRRSWVWVLVVGGLVGALGGACGDDDEGRPILEYVGRACTAAEQCYPDIDHAELPGAVVCLAEVQDGYCTHHCAVDADCCAVEGTCDFEAELAVLCAPFQSTGERYCFISCEDPGEMNADDYCGRWAYPGFICRSTGGGSTNRRVCVPPGG